MPPSGTLDLDDAADADLLDGGVLEVGDPGAGELALELALLGHEDLLVLLGHLVLGVLAQVAVLAGRGDRLGVLGDLLGDDGLVLLALALEAVAGDEELLLLGLGVGGDQRLDVREDLDEAGEERLLGQLLEALVQEEGVREVAGRLGVGGREQVGDQLGVVAQDVAERDAAGAGGLEGLVVDREEDGAQEPRGDQVVQQLGELLRVAVLDDPEEDRRAQVLLGLPALEGGGEVVGVAVLDQEIDALGRELALGDLEQVEDDVAALDRVGLLDQLEEAALELDGDLLGDGGQVAERWRRARPGRARRSRRRRRRPWRGRRGRRRRRGARRRRAGCCPSRRRRRPSG